MLLYSHIITPRLQYIADFAGRQLLGKPFQLVSDIEIFTQSPEPKLNYSDAGITAEEYWIQPHSLLFEKNIREPSVECFETENNKAFFKTEGDFPFDIFAASFYLLSRYEEYLPHKKDSYGRYAHENSLACKENFLHLPLINIWYKNLKEALQKKFPQLSIPGSQFRFVPTYDIDEAFSYKYKSRWRTAGAVVKDLLNGKIRKARERWRVLAEKLQDPFDSYQWMDNLHRQYKLKPVYFFLVAGRTGKYDRNILPKEKALQELIKQHHEKYETGVHPSWQSGDNPELIKTETAAIEKITGEKVTASRLHFIRFTLPRTYRYLIEAGIKKDFSMGYGSINGFRASVASPFYWYDLQKEETTDLLLFPFCYMEANSFFEQKLTPAQALDEMRHYYNEVKKINGTYISIWHNTFLGADKYYAGWRDVYEQFLKETG